LTATIASMKFGFDITLLLAAAIYLIAMFAFLALRPSSTQACGT
jgi:hypothetical protein